MAGRKSKVTKVTKKTVRKTKQVELQESGVPSYKSLSFGVISVVLLFLVGLLAYKLFFQKKPQGQISQEAAQTSTIEEKKDTTSDEKSKTGDVEYTVKEGDSLWSIAESHYKSGYNWIDVAKANNIANPGDIEKGTKLRLPQVEVKTLTAVEVPKENSPNITQKDTNAPVPTNKIEGTTYVIAKGDDLWDIAMRAYNDGYKWVEIAKANKLENPGLIHSGNTLVIPRG